LVLLPGSIGVKMKTYWTPTTKKQLIDWLKHNRPEWKTGKLKAMSKKQLYAIFYKIREGVKT